MMFFFFFSSRRRHTRFDCDWSSDVCSSDLPNILIAFMIASGGLTGLHRPCHRNGRKRRIRIVRKSRTAGASEIGRAACRGRVEISVGAVSLKKKKKKDNRHALMK